MLRKIGALAIIAAAAWAAHEFVWLPYRCNITKQVLRTTLLRASQNEGTYAARQLALRNEPLLASAARTCRRDGDILLLAGSNLLMIGRPEAASELHRQALAIDRNPTYYMAYGQAQLASGKREEALESFVTAAEFAGPSVLQEIADGDLRWAAHRIFGRRREALLARRGELDDQNLVSNPRFDAAGRSGPEARLDNRGQAPSAAAKWDAFSSRGTMMTILRPSIFRDGGKAVHVSTSSGNSGLRQSWPRTRQRPRVRTSALVFVERGRVCIGSGNGRRPKTDACSTTTGKWERLEAVNESCPANATYIVAAAPGGADFIVDEISARATLDVPCGG